MSMFPTRRVDGTSPTAAKRDAPAAPASLPRPSQTKGQGAESERLVRERIAAVAEDFPHLCWAIDPACRQVCIRDVDHGGPHGFEIDPGSGPGTPEEGDE